MSVYLSLKAARSRKEQNYKWNFGRLFVCRHWKHFLVWLSFQMQVNQQESRVTFTNEPLSDHGCKWRHSFSLLQSSSILYMKWPFKKISAFVFYNEKQGYSQGKWGGFGNLTLSRCLTFLIHLFERGKKIEWCYTQYLRDDGQC